MIYLLRLALIAAYTVFWGFVACAVALLDRSGERVIEVARQWVRSILASCRIQVDSEGLEALDLEVPYVIMSNHQSVFDVAAIVASWPRSFRFVAKRELTWIPLFGWALVLGGHVIIDRSRHARAVASLERAAHRIREGTHVIIFPEGTRSRTGELGPFKSGGFHLALQAQVPLLPVSICGSREITPSHSLRVESGRIRVRYGEPIPTAGLSSEDRTALKERVRRAIERGLAPADASASAAPPSARSG